MLECVINISEGRDFPRIRTIAEKAGPALLDVHSDPHHHRSVLTLAGNNVEEAARAVARETVKTLDLTEHHGVHPRIGVIDVVPFVALEQASFDDAVEARNNFARWAGDELELPCFFYGPERDLPGIRKAAFQGLTPDTGPAVAHPTAGASAVGARQLLVAYNFWLAAKDIEAARDIAAAIRTPVVRALGLQVGESVQVSCNLLSYKDFGVAELFDQVAKHATITRAELVGLVPADLLEKTPQWRWEELNIGPDRTIEHRLGRAR